MVYFEELYVMKPWFVNTFVTLNKSFSSIFLTFSYEHILQSLVLLLRLMRSLPFNHCKPCSVISTYKSHLHTDYKI